MKRLPIVFLLLEMMRIKQTRFMESIGYEEIICNNDNPVRGWATPSATSVEVDRTQTESTQPAQTEEGIAVFYEKKMSGTCVP